MVQYMSLNNISERFPNRATPLSPGLVPLVVREPFMGYAEAYRDGGRFLGRYCNQKGTSHFPAVVGTGRGKQSKCGHVVWSR